MIERGRGCCAALVEEEKESLACYLGYGEKREGLLVLCLDFSSY
jgi:hypothetical protein